MDKYGSAYGQNRKKAFIPNNEVRAMLVDQE